MLDRLRRVLDERTEKLLSGCHRYGGVIGTDGYGIIGFQAKHMRAHRASYLCRVGDIPGGAWVLHRCDNPTCINPAHLFLGTHQDNMTDMVKKDRSARGSGLPQSKLTEVDVLNIRRRIKTGEILAVIARNYGVSDVTIGQIKRREIWAWL